jgi:hypothetical protein
LSSSIVMVLAAILLILLWIHVCKTFLDQPLPGFAVFFKG